MTSELVITAIGALVLGLVLGAVVGYAVAVARCTLGPGAAAGPADDRLEARVRAAAAEALAANGEQFLRLADQRLAATTATHAGELRAREEAVKALVDPLTRTLEAVRAEVVHAEESRSTGQAALGEQVRAMREQSEALRSETQRLTTALRSSSVRGTWGEVQLRRVVEAAGMLERVDFDTQATSRTDSGVQRPDMVVHLAGGKHVVVDAKVALLAYLEAQDAEDESSRSERLAAHARQMRTHVDQLAAKAYWSQFTPAPEFVVMFVPAEAFLASALDADPTLLEHAFARNVVVATPTTLLALLRTVAYTWRQDALAANAQQVLDLGKELHSRIAVLGDHVTRLGRAIQTTAEAYNATVASLERRVLVSARRFSALDVADGELTTPAPVETGLSVIGAPELVAGAEAGIVGLEPREGTSGRRSG